MRLAPICAFCLFWLVMASPSRAIILYSTDVRNTSAPTGAYANSGWQYEGQFGGFLATVISKKFIITAGHIGGGVGTNFIFNGEVHRAAQVWQDPDSDLRIYQTVGSFNVAAPFFKDTTEVGRSCVMIGRGTQRGDPVLVNGVVHGWKWGASDGVQSWGRNAIGSIADHGGAQNSTVLRMAFDPDGVQYEGAYSAGDSGGAVFVKQGTVWKLAGINYSVDGQFSLNTDGSNPFDASIFNRGQLWTEGGNYLSAANGPPGASYATRISSRLDWISAVMNGHVAPGIPPTSNGIGVPAPEPAVVLPIACLMLIARRRAHSQTTHR